MLKKQYTDTILKSSKIIIDTREKENKHIIDYFESKKIKYEVKKLEYGDYAIAIEENGETYILDFRIERKASLEELSGNFTNDRVRIEEEFWRGSSEMQVVIESNSISNIINHKYRTEYNEKSFLASLLAFESKYDISFVFVEKEHTGEYIYKKLYYELRGEMK